jgi:hypothetical protein
VIAVSMDMIHIGRASQALARVEPDAVREIQKIMDHRFALGEAKARRSARVDTGENRTSTKGLVRDLPNGAEGVLEATSGHAAVMENGRRPGAKMPPRGVLLGWMGRHGIPERAEYAIRRAIAVKGIKADHNIEQTRDSLVPEIDADLRRVLGPIVRVALEGV